MTDQSSATALSNTSTVECINQVDLSMSDLKASMIATTMRSVCERKILIDSAMLLRKSQWVRICLRSINL
jgi:hypothetical protein